eukprot:s47_g35.t1
MNTTVGQDLLQAITPIQGLFPLLAPLNDQGPLGGYSGPGAAPYAPFLRHDDSFLHRLRTGFDASALAMVDCAAQPNTFLASRLCYCLPGYAIAFSPTALAIGGSLPQEVQVQQAELAPGCKAIATENTQAVFATL